MRALVVDDSRATRRMIGRILAELGIEAREAEHGRHALEVLDAMDEPPGLLLVDWNMPELDGLELVGALRRRPELAASKIMMVTTESDVDRMVAALEAGADEYAMKPFDAEVLREKLALLGVGEVA